MGSRGPSNAVIHQAVKDIDRRLESMENNVKEGFLPRAEYELRMKAVDEKINDRPTKSDVWLSQWFTRSAVCGILAFVGYLALTKIVGAT